MKQKSSLQMSASNKRDKIPARHLLPPNETCSFGNGLHLIEFSVKVFPWKPPKQPSKAKLLVALHELIAGRKQLHDALGMEKST